MNGIIKLLCALSIAILAISCDSKPATQEECEKMSMNIFRGLPNSQRDFNRSCQGIEVHYTKELCQNALVDLVYMADQLQLVEKYGELVMGCFNQNDLDKFRKN